MQDSTTREKVLKKIRMALIHKTANPFPQADFDSRLYNINDDPDEIIFAGQLTKAGGQFIFCEDKFDFAEHLTLLGTEKKWQVIICPDPQLGYFLNECEFPFQTETGDFKNAEVLISYCESLVSRTGSVLISSRQSHGRKLPGIAKVHVVVAYTSQLVNDIKDALMLMKSRYNGKLPSMMTFITGPSKTSDIELVQVTGAHGPAELYVFLIDQNDLE